MRYRISEDPFWNKQPDASFVNELLRPVHSETPARWNIRSASEGELSFSRLALFLDFPDREGLLETAYADFRAFMRVCNIEEGDKAVRLKILNGETECREAYKINITRDEILITAADTEGVRRALIFIEDEMRRREGNFLPLGEIRRRPHVRTRISRCFFSPPSHASNEGMVNELASDIDYYPDEYLNRLAHDGINGLWLGASFHDILKSDIIPECGADSERRLKKLAKVVDKCRRYGIEIYLLSIEPASGYSNPFLENHPELLGSRGRYGNTHLFCPSTDGCKKYIDDAITRLFTAVPQLAGFIGITTGECLSGCGSNLHLECPKCKETFGSHAATLAATEKMIVDAMKKVAPTAEFISWTYSQRSWDRETVKETCRLRDTAVIHMQNFEDLGKPVQLGKERIALDYWLSYVGPGEIMSDSLAINKSRGVRTYAKIQACSSHEISSVPYVPVPGILYDKYRFIRDNNISGVVQCWYFGNYPCMMNKAACELSFEPFFPDKESFLLHLAGIYWGSDAPSAVEAWKKFEKGYRNFPVSVSFEWFGPMQDSPAVPLHLKPVDLPMPSTWLVRDPVGGDRVGECLTDGHTFDEAIELSRRMYTEWGEGNAILSALSDEGKRDRAEQKSVASAIANLFRSGFNVLRFYDRRHMLGIGRGEPESILDTLEEIALEEMSISRTMIPLCEVDSRLGYHSEAHGYKFFKEKLEWRIGELQKMLDTEFPEVRRRIKEGLEPLPFYYGKENGARVVRISSAENPLEFVNASGGEAMTTVCASEQDGTVTVTFRMRDGKNDTLFIRPEFRMFVPSAPIELKDGQIIMNDNFYYSFFGATAEQRRHAIKCRYALEPDGTAVYAITLDRAKLGIGENEPFRLSVHRNGKHEEALVPDDRIFSRLIQAKFSPDSYAFFIK